MDAALRQRTGGPTNKQVSTACYPYGGSTVGKAGSPADLRENFRLTIDTTL